MSVSEGIDETWTECCSRAFLLRPRLRPCGSGQPRVSPGSSWETRPRQAAGIPAACPFSCQGGIYLHCAAEWVGRSCHHQACQVCIASRCLALARPYLVNAPALMLRMLRPLSQTSRQVPPFHRAHQKGRETLRRKSFFNSREIADGVSGVSGAKLEMKEQSSPTLPVNPARIHHKPAHLTRNISLTGSSCLQAAKRTTPSSCALTCLDPKAISAQIRPNSLRSWRKVSLQTSREHWSAR